MAGSIPHHWAGNLAVAWRVDYARAACFGPGIAQRFRWASTLQSEDSEEKVEERSSIRTKLHELLGTDSLLIIPTIPGTAPDRNISGDAADKQRALTMQLCCIAGLSGLPQVTIPVGEVDGAPIGLSIIAGAGRI